MHSPRYEAALQYAAQKHEGQFRRGGLAYITHPVAVANILEKTGADEYTLIAALFHDLLEDTNATEQEITVLGGECVTEAVRLLTKHPGYDMRTYIEGIRSNPIAFAVKGADRLHNLQSALVTDDTFKRKYIAETRAWYMDFHPDIPKAVEALEQTLIRE